MLDKLTKNLFWDVDWQDFNTEKHQHFIVKRVAMRGDVSDWKTVEAYYTKSICKQELLKARYLDKKTLNFFSHYFNEPVQNFRCYKLKQLMPSAWEY